MKKTIGTALLFLLVAAPAIAGPNGGGASGGSRSSSLTPGTPLFSGGAQPHGGATLAGIDPASRLKGGDPAEQDHFKWFSPDAKPQYAGALVEQKPRCIMIPSPDLRGASCVVIPI